VNPELLLNYLTFEPAVLIENLTFIYFGYAPDVFRPDTRRRRTDRISAPGEEDISADRAPNDRPAGFAGIFSRRI